MKLESKPSEIRTSKQFQEMQFGIKETDVGLILEILRSKMYKNPIGAICREVASNSRDANREAENNVPIEITICDNKLLASEMTIQFKDNGPGISPDRMANVFINYGASTKRDTNEFTGGFGLGAKTPFSYSDNFAIETVVDGVHYSWICAVEEGRKGKIFLIDSNETQDPTGTTIIVPIKSGDRDTFEKEVFKATLFWPMRPTYKNFRTSLDRISLEVAHDDDKYLIVKQNFFNSQYALLLDGILYSIDSGIMNFASRPLYDYLVIFKFETGDLTISANREALQYDDKTKKTIQTRFNELLVLCYNNYKTEYDLNKNWLQAALFYKKRTTNLYYKIIYEHESSQINKLDYWNGKSLKDTLASVFPTLNFFKCYLDKHDNKISRVKSTDVDEYLQKMPVFLFDESLGYHLYKDMTIFASNNEYIAIKPADAKMLKWSELPYKEKKGFAKTMRKFLNDLEKLSDSGIVYSNYSLVEKAKVSKDPSVKDNLPRFRKPDTIKVNVFNFSYDSGRRSSNSNYEYVTVKEEKIYRENATAPADASKFALVLVEDIQRPETSVVYTPEMQMLRFAIKAKLVPEFVIIYANKNRGKILEGIIQPLSEFGKLLTPMVITQLVDGQHIRELINNDLNRLILKLSYVSVEFSTIVDNINKIVKGYNKDSYLPDDLLKKYESFSKFKDMAKEIEKIQKVCPLLLSLSYYNIDKTNVEHYVNLVEADLIAKGEIK